MLLAGLVHASPVLYVPVPAARFRTALPPDGKSAPATTNAFRVRALPVTNGEFLEFVRAQPQWRRGQVPVLFADGGYLAKWEAPDRLGASVRPDQPVVQVSWFAADAFCRGEGGRLPTWHEWEQIAAADELRSDAREDPRWRERMLRWYSRPSTGVLPPVGKTPRNVYGVYDVHGVVWEWVDDFNSVMVATDSREQGDPDLQKFCGAGAVSMQDRENYAVLMHLALLSSLQAAYTTNNLGFRCVRDQPRAPQAGAQ
jgi:formylglycine-generating enzyme required for sulfatase activity